MHCGGHSRLGSSISPWIFSGELFRVFTGQESLAVTADSAVASAPLLRIRIIRPFGNSAARSRITGGKGAVTELETACAQRLWKLYDLARRRPPTSRQLAL